MHFQLYKEDVLDLLREYPEFSDYSMEQLKSDLEALVGWKNLTPIQDPKRVYTIAEYKNKQYRYTMSEYAVEIERMTVKLENLFMDSGNLSMNYFVRIENALNEMEQIDRQELKAVNEWWSNLQEDFKRLNRNYQDYLREFYSGKSDKMLKSIEFVIHKDRFISYQSNNFLLMLSPLPFFPFLRIFLILKLKYISGHHQIPILAFQRMDSLLFY